MKNLTIALLFLPFIFAFKAGDLESGSRKSLPAGCMLRSTTAVSGISVVQTKCEFTFKTTYGDIISDSILFSHNGVKSVLHPDKSGITGIVIPSGATRFQFYYNHNFYEIYSDTIQLKGGYLAKFDVFFEDATSPVICDKPVIYFYPKATTSVHAELNVKGELGFTYPRYYMPGPMDSAQPGWSFKVDPSGTIHQDGKQYDYLFWEGSVSQSHFNNSLSEGFFVKRDSLVPFFERNLTAMGLNYREQQDFITYWVPLMQKNETSFVHFMFTEEYDSIATLQVTPQPDHIFRVFMVWRDADMYDYTEVSPQIIPHATREGFTVIEWGGGELSDGFEKN